MEEPTGKDEAIKQFCQDKALLKARQVAEFLERIALDPRVHDRKKVKRKDDNGEIIYDDVEVPLPMSVRVTAAKVWKEMFFDKAIGDVKEKAKEARKTGIDMKAALESLTQAKLEARRDEKETDL